VAMLLSQFAIAPTL